MHTRRTLSVLLAVFLIATACGEEATVGGAAGTCLADDPSCEGFDDTAPPDNLPPDLPGDDHGSFLVEVTGLFYMDDEGAYVCGVFADSLPPICGEQLATFEGEREAILAYVGELTGDADPSTSHLKNVDNTWWSDDPMSVWILPGEDIVRVE